MEELLLEELEVFKVRNVTIMSTYCMYLHYIKKEHMAIHVCQIILILIHAY